MPKVSVILPNYNHAQFLIQRIESILNQTFQDFELIILDDCSPDNSKQTIEPYRNHPRVSQIVFNTQNSGSTFKQWEKGINLAKGEYIWLAESDDYCESRFLSELVTKLDEYPNAGIAYCQSRSVDQNNTPINSWIKQTNIFSPNLWEKSFITAGQEAITNFLIHRNIIPNASAVVFRKSAYNSTHGINTSMKLNGDWLLWISILQRNDLIFIAKELNFFRQHTNKATGTHTRNYNGLKEMIDIFIYLQSSLELNEKQKKVMTDTCMRRWIYQLATGNIISSCKNIPRIAEISKRLDKQFYLNFFSVAIDIFVQKVILHKPSPKKDLNKVSYTVLT
jgi:glycosyltransferase involved in cell wall biosynthesis